jgi:predicted Zn finger-like uncharacterized protein
MFTECPECSTGFRVTPQVLKQAGGRVRCGGCGNAFSAIDHLTEEPPGADNNVDNPAGDDLQTDDKFAEASRQLLETLDELAGPDEVRIEDTGIEWRVLDDIEGIAAEAAPTDAADAEASQESLDLDVPGQEPQEERRYDDNTPLPDELEDEEEYQYTPPAPKRRESDSDDADTTEFDEKQADLALSEPEDWTELLDEVVDEGAAAGNIPLEVEEELAAIHSELSAKEAPPAVEPEDDPVPADIDSQFEMQAEAMGIDISGIHETAKEQSEEDDEEEVEAPVDDADENDLTDVVPLLDEDEEEIAADTEIDLAEDDEAIEEEVAELESAEELESTGEFEAKIDVAAKALVAEEEEDKDDIALNDVIELSLEDDDEVEIPAEAEIDEELEDVGDTSEFDEIDISATGSLLNKEAEATGKDKKMDFAATLVGMDDPSKLFDEDSGDVETIIMEGEFIHDSKETARLHAESEAKKRFKNANSLVDTYAANRGVRGGRRRTDPAGYGVIAGTIFLALLLGGQFMHAYRETLSTYGFFNQTVGPVYRMLGNPVTPQWDIKGWQFEATNGSVAEASEVLTIVSRIGNKSQQPLPYPLVHVSLTDRYEEIIGSRVLEPNEYLAGDLDPSKPVVFGENFTAVITIDEPSAEATGFKLNVCYRDGPTRVRCAIEDFKNQD